MPLINLRTNLKTTAKYTSTDPNLAYGHDRKDFGSSNQPYIVTPIPDGNDNVRSSPDFLLRNGFLNNINSLNDVERISKFLNPFGPGATAKGVLFVLKQELLEKQNVKVENGFRRIFNPVQPVAQAGVLSIGYHLNKQGFDIRKPGYFSGGKEGYFNITNQNNTNDRNRLTLLYTIKTLQQRLTEPASTLYGITNPFDTTNLISYSGGPNAPVLGFGKTNIRIQNPLRFFVEAKTENTTATYSTNENIPATYLAPTAVNITKVYASGSARSFGSQTSFNRSRANSTSNPQDPKYKLNPNLSISSDQAFAEGEDIINFSFTLINNNGTGASNPNTFINLRAYIDDFNDSYIGDWDSYKYMGRAENFYRYKGFTRDMSITFTVPVLSRADMITTYQKLNALTWLTMPDYSDVGIMRGNLAYFTMGDYLRHSIIVVKSLNYTPIMEMGFDINRKLDNTLIKEITDSEYTGQLPKGIKVTTNIIPLTSETVSGSGNFYTPQRGEAFIGNRKHVIVDREGVKTTYSYAENLAYTANDPSQSPLIKPTP